MQSLTWPELHPDDLQADLDKFEKFRKGEIKSYSMEKRFLLPDGSAVWTNMTISPFLGAPYKDIMHLCLLEDISMRKQAEAALSESERSKSVLLLISPVWLIDAKMIRTGQCCMFRPVVLN